MITKPSFTSSSEATSPFRRAAVFAGLLVAFLWALDAGIAHLIVTDTELKYREVFRGDRPFERIILGTSHAAYGIAPRHLERDGVRPYNFGYSAATATFYLDWYAIYRRHHPAPRQVLLSVDWVLLRESRGSHQFAQDSEFYPPALFIEALARPGAPVQQLVANRFPLVKERDRYQVALFGQKNWQDCDLSKYDNGFAPIAYRTPDLKPPGRFPDIQPGQVAAFETLMRRLQADGAAIVMLQTPEYLAPTGHDDDTALYERFAHAFRVPFLNYNKAHRSAINADASLYNDWQHLNERGVDVFSRRLARDVAAFAPARPLD